MISLKRSFAFFATPLIAMSALTSYNVYTRSADPKVIQEVFSLAQEKKAEQIITKENAAEEEFKKLQLGNNSYAQGDRALLIVTKQGYWPRLVFFKLAQPVEPGFNTIMTSAIPNGDNISGLTVGDIHGKEIGSKSGFVTLGDLFDAKENFFEARKFACRYDGCFFNA